MAPRRAGDAEEETALTGLTFNEPLSWRAGKPIATGELLRRLDSLSDELREMDQDEVDKDSLTKVAKELVGQNLLGHKDKGVRAFTACCLVDVLKLCAPDAPFTPSQLKDIFTLIVTYILPALSDPSHAYNSQHKYVLVSLSTVKSIILVCDVSNSDSLILHIFSSFFDIVSGSSRSSTGESIAKDVEFHMTQLLAILVDEAQSLPVEVVDIIVAQFLRVSTPKTVKGRQGADDKQATLLLKELPEAYNMAKTICNSCSEKMARYVSQYFNDVILDVTGGAPKSNGQRKTDEGDQESEEDEVPAGPSDADMNELEKAHKLLRELWRASPTVLQNVIPQLEAELSADNVELRVLATETLGDIISGIGAAGPPPPPPMDPAAYPPVKLEDCAQMPVSNSILTTPISPQSFAQTHPTTYNTFMGRKNDKSSVIRSIWTTAVGRILGTSAGGIGLSREEEATLIRGFAEKLGDSDEKVRLAAVKAVGIFGFWDIMTKIAPNGSVSKSGSILGTLADRARDRKHAVRVEAMTTLAKLWGVAAGEIAAGNETVAEALGTIPSKIFDAFYTNDPEVNALLDHVMFEQLIPLSYPPSKIKGSKANNGDSQTQANEDGPYEPDKLRTERILLLVKSLDLKARKAFFAMQARQPTYSKVLEAFLANCEKYNGGVIEEDAKITKGKLDATIKWFTDLLPDPLRTTNELHKYAKMHDRRSYQLLRFAMDPKSDFNTVHKAIKEIQKRILAAPGAPAGLGDTLLPIIYRSACLIYNRSHQPIISQYARTDENDLGHTANIVMKEISDKYPEIFKASVNELCKSLGEQAPSKSKSNDLSSVETLKALASFAKAGNKIPSDRRFIQTLINFALYGTPSKAGKYAVNILAAVSERKEMHMKDLLDKSIENWTYGGDHFLTKLATLSQLNLLAPKITEDYNDEVIDITTSQILLRVRTPASDIDSDWCGDADVDEECQSKIWAIKTLVNRLRTVEDLQTAKTLAQPVYKLLNVLIAKNGELSKQNDTPKHHKSRLRLLAAQQMLKLCRIDMFEKLLSLVEFNRLAFVAQDALPQVRAGFIEKLQKYIVKDKLPSRFLTIMFLTTFEPSQTFKNSIMTWIRSRVKVCHDTKKRSFEAVFPRLLHLLAHHPDFSVEPDELKDIGRYIIYYLTTVASEENLPLIYLYSERVKQTRDALPGANSDNLYIMSDLAQSLVKRWEEKKGWSMQTWPTKVGMPVGLFAGLSSHEAAQEIAKKNYLPDDMDPLLDELVRNAEKRKQKRKSTDKDESRPSKRAKSERPVKTPAPKKDRRTKEKKTPKPRKIKDPDEFSTPTASFSTADRRKSGRGASAKKVYVERDDEEDDEDMLNGVASWEYLDGHESEEEEEEEEEEGEEGSEAGSDDAEEAEEEDVEMGDDKPATPEETVEVEEDESALSSEPEAEAEENAEPVEEEDEEQEQEVIEDEEPPKRKRGRPSKSNTVSASVTKVTKGKATPKMESSPAIQAAAKPMGRPKAAAGVTKEKAKALPTRAASTRSTRARRVEGE